MRLCGLAGVVVVAGCAIGKAPPGDGGQFGEENGARCTEIARTPLALDEVSPLGFSAAEVIAHFADPPPDVLRYDAGSETELGLTLAATGAHDYVEYEWQSDDSDGYANDIAMSCAAQVEIAADLAFRTADGVFDESFAVVVPAVTADSASVWIRLEDTAGTFDPWDYVPADSDYEEVRAALSFTLGPTGIVGTVSGDGSGTYGVDGGGTGEDAVAYDEMFGIASFGDAEE